MSSKFTTNHLMEIVMIVVSTIATIGSIGQIYFDGKTKQETLTYEKQIESLNTVSNSIDTLREFVIEQKENLKKSQQTLSELKSQQEILKPVIEADQKAIDAIFALQAEQNKKNIWWERAIGFFIGITGSLIASLIWSFTRNKA